MQFHASVVYIECYRDDNRRFAVLSWQDLIIESTGENTKESIGASKITSTDLAIHKRNFTSLQIVDHVPLATGILVGNSMEDPLVGDQMGVFEGYPHLLRPNVGSIRIKRNSNNNA